jgi:hypothetical protein
MYETILSNNEGKAHFSFQVVKSTSFTSFIGHRILFAIHFQNIKLLHLSLSVNSWYIYILNIPPLTLSLTLPVIFGLHANFSRLEALATHRKPPAPL